MNTRFIVLFAFLLSTTVCLADTHIPGGPVSGLWTAENSPYYIDGEVYVPNNDTLIIEPGCSIIFTVWRKFRVDLGAVLKAIGTQDDSIVFKAENESIFHGGGFGGIHFMMSSDACSLEYCQILFGRSDSDGGGIYCNSSDITIKHCYIHKNIAHRGGGIFVTNSSGTVIDSCYISYNYIYRDQCLGGGICCDAGADILIENNIIDSNSDNGSSDFGYGGGIYVRNSSPTIINNIISNNGTDFGGGMRARESNSYIANNVFFNNHAAYDYYIIDYRNTNLKLINNTFVNGSMRISGNSKPIALNTIFALSQFYIESPSTLFVSHCLTNLTDEISGLYVMDTLYRENPWISEIDNIHIMNFSPCIDAGADYSILSYGDTVYAPSYDIDNQPRPNGSAIDIGADENYLGDAPNHIPQMIFAPENYIYYVVGQQAELKFVVADYDSDYLEYNPIYVEPFISDSVFHRTGQIDIILKFNLSDYTARQCSLAFDVCDYDTCISYTKKISLIPLREFRLDSITSVSFPENIKSVDTIGLWDKFLIEITTDSHKWILDPLTFRSIDAFDAINTLTFADIDSDFSLDWLEKDGDSIFLHISSSDSVKSRYSPNCQFGKIIVQSKNNYKIIVGKQEWGRGNIPYPIRGCQCPDCGCGVDYWNIDLGPILNSYLLDMDLDSISSLSKYTFPVEYAKNLFAGVFDDEGYCISMYGSCCQYICCEDWWQNYYLNIYSFNNSSNQFELKYFEETNSISKIGYDILDSLFFVVSSNKLYLLTGDTVSSYDLPQPYSAQFIPGDGKPSAYVHRHDTLYYCALTGDSVVMSKMTTLPSNQKIVKMINIDGENYILAIKNNTLIKYKIVNDIPYIRGWNLCSYPYSDTVSVEDIYPSAVLPAYRWNNSVSPSHWESVNRVYAGFGFWLFSLTGEHPLYPSEVDEVDTVTFTLYPGWNLIGSPAGSIPIDEALDAPGIITPVYTYDPISHSYIPVYNFVPYKGYWILSLDTISIELP